ncbi:hypothetical protein J3F83DRAFT_29543 [Trichoderma novae-zelandiae]
MIAVVEAAEARVLVRLLLFGVAQAAHRKIRCTDTANQLAAVARTALLHCTCPARCLDASFSVVSCRQPLLPGFTLLVCSFSLHHSHGRCFSLTTSIVQHHPVVTYLSELSSTVCMLFSSFSFSVSPPFLLLRRILTPYLRRILSQLFSSHLRAAASSTDHLPLLSSSSSWPASFLLLLSPPSGPLPDILFRCTPLAHPSVQLCSPLPTRTRFQDGSRLASLRLDECPDRPEH